MASKSVESIEITRRTSRHRQHLRNAADLACTSQSTAVYSKGSTEKLR